MKDEKIVPLELKFCEICVREYDKPKKVLQVFNKYATPRLGGHCEHCSELLQRGYVALVEIDLEKSGIDKDADTVTVDKAHRTGLILWTLREFASAALKCNFLNQDYAFVDSFTVSQIELLVATAEQKRKKEDGSL